MFVIINYVRLKPLFIKQYSVMKLIIIIIIIIGINDLGSLFKGCKDVSADWKIIGSALGIKKNTLDALENDYIGSKKRMFEMLAVWLRRESVQQPVPTWHILIRAVSDSVGITEAENIAENFFCTHDIV